MVLDNFLQDYLGWNYTNLGVPHSSCVILNKLLSVSEPQFHLEN